MSKKYRFIPFLALLSASLLLAGCDGDPENDDDIIDLDDIVDIEEFDISNYDELTTSTDLKGVWVAAGTGTFSRDEGGDAKYGDQVALIYFVIQGSSSAGYEYANCFDTGILEGGFDRGGYEDLSVDGTSIVFTSLDDDVDDDEDGNDDMLSEDDDYSNEGTLTGFSAISSVFTFDDGDSVETNTFEMIKVSDDISTFIGTTKYAETNETTVPDELACFAQWVGSYDTTEGLYQVERYDASLNESIYPFTTSNYDSDEEDTEKQYSSISYGSSTSATAQEDDEGDGINASYFLNSLRFNFEDSSSVEYAGELEVTHADLIGR